MKHKIRQRVINEYGLPVVKIETLNCELGSGVLDENGCEIFEGDLVRVNPLPYMLGEEEEPPRLVTFEYGRFFVGDMPMGDCVYLEVVGHND